jgi:carbonic anhydrase
MHRRQALKAFAGLLLCPICAQVALSAGGPHWNFEAGADGPEHWGDLDPAFRVCGIGSQQSPIDVGGGVEAQLPQLTFAWANAAGTIVNTGHTIQVNASPGSTLTAGGARYTLVQFHFHHPAEHQVDGKVFPLEAHFVHEKDGGGLGVIGVFMAAGKSNPVFKKVVETMPATEGPPVAAGAGIDPNGLLPQSRGYYRYEGSLTTPPCSEVVDWMLFTAPIEVAEAEISAFAKLFPMNARPLQKANRRFVLRSA